MSRYREGLACGDMADGALVIAARLGVTDKTVAKAIAWLRNAVLR